MKDRIIEMLERGERVELECVDREGFIDSISSEANRRILEQESLIIKKVNYDEERFYLDGNVPLFANTIAFSELKYFKIKEPEYTFNDLINEIKKILLEHHSSYNEKYNHEAGNYYEGVCDGIGIALEEIDNFNDNKNTELTFDDLLDVTAQAIKDGVLPKKVIKISDFLIEMNIDGKDRLFNSEDAADGVDFIKSLYTETFVIEHQSDLSKIKLNDKKTKIELANGTLVSDEILDMLKDQSGKTQLSILKGATVTQKRGERK